MPVIAHLGHWYESVAYAAPMVIIGGVLWYASRQERKEGVEPDHWDGEDDPQWQDDADEDPRLKD